jgi:hypothetical protein
MTFMAIAMSCRLHSQRYQPLHVSRPKYDIHGTIIRRKKTEPEKFIDERKHRILTPKIAPQKKNPKFNLPTPVYFLTRAGLDLRSGSLSTLLGNLLSTGSTGSVLGLLGLLLALSLSLLLLTLLDGLGTGGLAGLGTEGTLLLDHVKGKTNDGTLGLDGAAGALLGDLLWGNQWMYQL